MKQAVRVLFSPDGRLRPQPFVIGAIAVYLAGLASQWLAGPDVVSRTGLWPFLAVQAVLIWIWFVLHARRLHDAGRASGIAAGASVLYALSLALLLIVAIGYFNPADGPMSNPNASATLNLILILYIVTNLLGSLQYGVAWAFMAILIGFAFVPIIVALAVTLWAATRPTAEHRS